MRGRYERVHGSFDGCARKISTLARYYSTTTFDRKEAARRYKETPRTMGVLVIRNKTTGRALVGSSTDVPARLNRHRAALQFGKHPSRELQNDWNTLGAEAFEFAVLDTLKPSEEKASDPSEDLAVLEAMWRDKLSAAGELY